MPLRQGAHGQGDEQAEHHGQQERVHHLHADGETQPNDVGAASIKESPGPYLSPERVVISFGPEHAPMDQVHVESALQEAQRLVPRPNLILFAAFQFDP